MRTWHSKYPVCFPNPSDYISCLGSWRWSCVGTWLLCRRRAFFRNTIASRPNRGWELLEHIKGALCDRDTAGTGEQGEESIVCGFHIHRFTGRSSTDTSKLHSPAAAPASASFSATAYTGPALGLWFWYCRPITGGFVTGSQRPMPP